MLKHFEEKPLKKPDYGTLFPLLKRMRAQADKEQSESQRSMKEEAKAELQEIEEEPPPVRLVVQDSQLLLLEGKEPEDAYYAKKMRRELSEDLIVLSDDADDIKEDASAEVHLSVQASRSFMAQAKFPVPATKGVLDQEIIDLEELAHNSSFIEEQCRMEALFQAKVSASQHTQTPSQRTANNKPSLEKENAGVSSTGSRGKSRDRTEVLRDAPTKKSKASPKPDPKQPTLFSFLTRSKSSNLQ